MPFPTGVRPWKIKEFSNAHKNFIQPLDEDQSFDIFLDHPDLRSLSHLEQYNASTSNLQWVIGQAMARMFNIRAVGSGWSLSPVAVSDDVLVNTKNLRLRFTLSEGNFLPEFLAGGGDPGNYRFVQCGLTMVHLNRYLEQDSQPAKSISVSGGSNGQTLAGAFSTGTHGASIQYGAISEMVRGLHIVTGPDRHVYLEPSSRPITSGDFHAKIGAEVIVDDDLFYAALVSFGSFGIIHGILIEVEDKFLLEQKLTRVPYDANMEKAVAERDYSAIEAYLKYPLDDQDHPLYHFELAVNLHDFAFDDPEKGAYLRVMHKAPYREDYDRIDLPAGGYTYGDDLLGLLQKVLDTLRATAGFLDRLLIPGLVKALFNVAYNRPEEAVGTIGETFANTQFRGNLFSAAFAFDRADLRQALDTFLEVNRHIKLAGALGIRFVKGTRATLGFTRWPDTCVVELDGADAHVNHLFTRRLAEKLEEKDITYTVHWGKINRILTPQRLEKMYGASRIRQWKKQRSRIMGPEAQLSFNNAFMEQCGLDDYLPPDLPDHPPVV